MDQATVERWIARLDQYHFKTVHRPRTQHRNADAISKKTNVNVHREKIVDLLEETKNSFSCLKMTMKIFPLCHTLTNNEIAYRITLSFLRKLEQKLPVLLYILKKQHKEEPTSDQSLNSIP